MSEFTEGPWYVDGRMVSTSPIQSVCAMIDFDSFGGEVPAHNWKANAHLIAAEPEMYEALEWLETYARVQVDRYPDAEDNKGWKRILSALAKARGEA